MILRKISPLYEVKKRIHDDIQQKYKYKKFYFKSGIYKTINII